jgi:hypothetical protein
MPQSKPRLSLSFHHEGGHEEPEGKRVKGVIIPELFVTHYYAS